MTRGTSVLPSWSLTERSARRPRAASSAVKPRNETRDPAPRPH
ncbi:hypothetical protein ACFOLD_07780 [Kocuria carniphila]